MLDLYNAIFGVTEFLFSKRHGKEAINIALKRGKEVKARANGELVWVRCARRDRKNFLDILQDGMLEVLDEKERGLLPVLYKYKTRIGIFVGAILFLIFTVLSGCLVWRIDVSGNEALSDEQVVMALENSGIRVGMPAQFDSGAVAARCVAENDALAWMSIRMEGTTARVRVIEATVPKTPEISDGKNLVAKRDALIISVEASRGRVEARPGTVVRKGDVLVSGVVEGAHGALFVEAEGRVWGQVTECFREEVALSSWKKEYSSPRKGEFWIKILGFSINIFKSTGNLPPTYDTIYSEGSLRIGGRALPLSFARVEYVPYKATEHILEKDVAIGYAKAMLYERVRLAIGDGELLESNTQITFENGKCIAVCTATYVTEIACSVPFEIQE